MSGIKNPETTPAVTTPTTKETLPELKQFFEDNEQHGTSGGITTDDIFYEGVAHDIALGNASPNKHLETRINGKLVAYGRLTPSDPTYDLSDVEAAGLVDKNSVRQGIGKISLQAMVGYAHEQNLNIVAAVDQHNKASLGLLHSLGFEDQGYDDGRVILSREPVITKASANKFFM